MSEAYVTTTDTGRIVLELDREATRLLIDALEFASQHGVRVPLAKLRLQHQLERRPERRNLERIK